MISSSHPVTTGGSTSGRCTNALSTAWPGKRLRARTQAVTTASGSPKPTARAATPSVSSTASHSSGERISLLDLEAALLEDRARLGAGEIAYQRACLRCVAGSDHGERIGHRVVAVGGKHAGDDDAFRSGRIRCIDDTR